MSRNTREFDCTPEAVFEVLADAWLFPSWVVGASRMRDVEAHWPDPGAKLHHSVGTWPLLLDDETVSILWQPPTRMVLQAKGRPIGEARVTIDVKPRGAGCVVRIQEEAVRGPGRLMPDFLADVLLHARNAETLQRLAYLAEGRQANGERTEKDGTSAADGGGSSSGHGRHGIADDVPPAEQGSDSNASDGSGADDPGAGADAEAVERGESATGVGIPAEPGADAVGSADPNAEPRADAVGSAEPHAEPGAGSADPNAEPGATSADPNAEPRA